MSTQEPQPLIIDTDVALGVWHEGRPRDIDDGFAIVEAINSPQLDLMGICTVFGNGPHDEVYRVAQELVALKNSGTPVHPGANEPLPQQGALPPPNAAVEFMADCLTERACAIAAIGPLTNLGLLAHHYPHLIPRITQVIVVAGRTPGNQFMLGEAGPVMDFNFENDVRATDLLLSSGAAIVLAGFELTSQVVITADDLRTIAARGNDTAQYFYDNSLAWCEYWTKTFPVDAGFHPWDSAAISWLKHPQLFVAEPRAWRIVTGERGVPELHCARLEAEGAHTLTYLSGFEPDGARRFVADVVDFVY